MSPPAVLLVFAACALLAAPARMNADALARDRRGATVSDASPTALTPRNFARALLAETNRVRRAHYRRPLKAKAELEAAADDQAAFMALRLETQHGSFLAGQATARERVRRHGLEGIAVAENVASATLGESLDEHSAEAIAAQLVAQWMASPGHRATLLDRRFTQFGGSVRLVRIVGGTWVAYGAQVFLIAKPPFGHVSS